MASRFETSYRSTFNVNDPKSGENRLLAGTVVPEQLKPRESGAVPPNYKPMPFKSLYQAEFEQASAGGVEDDSRRDHPLMMSEAQAAQAFAVAGRQMYNQERTVNRRADKDAPVPKQRIITNINKQSAGIHDDMIFVSTFNQDRSTAQTDFGTYGSNPRDRMPQSERDINNAASSKELFSGTVKATGHPPGYSGFLPASNLNPKATAQASGAAPKRPQRHL